MAYSAGAGKPPGVPLAAISAFFHNTDMPKPPPTPFGADNLVAGFITHLTVHGLRDRLLGPRRVVDEEGGHREVRKPHPCVATLRWPRRLGS